jgi:hypothetical protein
MMCRTVAHGQQRCGDGFPDLSAPSSEGPLYLSIAFDLGYRSGQRLMECPPMRRGELSERIDNVLRLEVIADNCHSPLTPFYVAERIRLNNGIAALMQLQSRRKCQGNYPCEGLHSRNYLSRHLHEAFFR